MLHFAAGHFQVQTFWKLWNHMPVAYGCALQITDEEPFLFAFNEAAAIGAPGAEADGSRAARWV